MHMPLSLVPRRHEHLLNKAKHSQVMWKCFQVMFVYLAGSSSEMTGNLAQAIGDADKELEHQTALSAMVTKIISSPSGDARKGTLPWILLS